MSSLMRIRLLAVLTMIFCAVIIWAYYRHIGGVCLMVYRPVRAALTVLLAAQAAGFCITRLIAWRPANWREAVPFQLCIGLAVISYMSFGLALANAYRPPNVRWFVDAVLILSSVFATYTFLRWYRQNRGTAFGIVREIAGA